jgi:hypothetical protein
MSVYIKDPDAVLDYSIDWSGWLDGDAIVTSTWSVAGGITIDSTTNTSTVATVWLSGGSAGRSYKIVNHIVTSGGREDDRTLEIVVRER